MEKFVHEEEPTVDELRRAIRRATLAGEGVPGPVRLRVQEQGDPAAARRDRGVPPGAARTYRRCEGHTPTGEHAERKPDDTEPFSGLVFKIMSDPYVGRLTYVRVYSGVLRSGSHVENTTKDRKERIGRILQMHANHREDMEAAFTGDIVAVVGLKHSSTGDTLADPANPIVLESISFPTPVISVAVEPKTKADQDKLGTGLGKLSDEDPTFVVKYDDETGQTVISGMGELHLDIIVDRLRREFSVDANVGKPQVAYRETIRKPVSKVAGPVHPADRWPRAVRSRRHRRRADRPRRRLRVREQDRRRQDPARVHPVRRRRHRGGDGDRRVGRLSARRRAGHARSTARTTRSTPRRWRSRSPVRWR